LPKFVEDTKSLAADPERAEKMNIDVMDEPTDDKKVIEMVNFEWLNSKIKYF